MARKTSDGKTENKLKSISKKAVSKDTPKKSGKKSTKSTDKQAQDLLTFGTAVVGGATAFAKTAGKGKNKKQKRIINLVVAVVVLAVLVCGGMYYFDQAPFDFAIGSADGFKFYSYEDYEYQVSKPSAGVVGAVSDGQLTVHFIDVGQGDSIFVQFPDGKTLLIDGAKNSNSIADGIISYITALYPDKQSVDIDYCMLTHCDSDHCGSLDNVIASDKINVKNVYQPRVLSSFASDPLKELATNYTFVPSVTTNVYSSFVQAVYNEKQTVGTNIFYNFEGEYFSGDGWSIHIYNPSEEMYSKLSTAQDKNNISPIMVLKFNDTEILFTGDADDKAERNFLANLTNLTFDDGYTFGGDVEILKVGHHGGSESTSNDFLNVIKPEYAVISVGTGNTYGHPRQDALDRLGRYVSQSNLYRTDMAGNVVLTVKGNEIKWSIDKPTTSAQLYYYDAAFVTNSLVYGTGVQ